MPNFNHSIPNWIKGLVSIGKKEEVKVASPSPEELPKGDFTVKEIQEHWSNGKPINYKGTDYRVVKMSYGTYFLEPGEEHKEGEGFNEGTLELEKVEKNPQAYKVASKKEAEISDKDINKLIRNYFGIPKEFHKLMEDLQDTNGEDDLIAEVEKKYPEELVSKYRTWQKEQYGKDLTEGSLTSEKKVAEAFKVGDEGFIYWTSGGNQHKGKAKVVTVNRSSLIAELAEPVGEVTEGVQDYEIGHKIKIKLPMTKDNKFSLTDEEIAPRVQKQVKLMDPSKKEETIRRIVEQGQYEKIEGQIVDGTTASMFVSLLNALKPDQKEKFLAFPISKMVSVGWQLYSKVKAGSKKSAGELKHIKELVDNSFSGRMPRPKTPPVDNGSVKASLKEKADETGTYTVEEFMNNNFSKDEKGYFKYNFTNPKLGDKVYLTPEEVKRWEDFAKKNYEGANSKTYNSIEHGDRVTITTPHGEVTGIAQLLGPAGWVLMKGNSVGSPAGIAHPDNIVKVRKSKKADKTPKIYEDPDNPNAGEYIVKLKHDKGTVRIHTYSTSADDAVKQVCEAEGCPESAVISVERGKPGPDIHTKKSADAFETIKEKILDVVREQNKLWEEIDNKGEDYENEPKVKELETKLDTLYQQLEKIDEKRAEEFTEWVEIYGGTIYPVEDKKADKDWYPEFSIGDKVEWIVESEDQENDYDKIPVGTVGTVTKKEGNVLYVTYPSPYNKTDKTTYFSHGIWEEYIKIIEKAKGDKKADSAVPEYGYDPQDFMMGDRVEFIKQDNMGNGEEPVPVGTIGIVDDNADGTITVKIGAGFTEVPWDKAEEYIKLVDRKFGEKKKATMSDEELSTLSEHIRNGDLNSIDISYTGEKDWTDEEYADKISDSDADLDHIAEEVEQGMVEGELNLLYIEYADPTKPDHSADKETEERGWWKLIRDTSTEGSKKPSVKKSAKLYSVYDTQVGRYLETGKNSDTREQAINEAFEYYIGGDELEPEDKKLIKNYGLKEKEEMLEGAELLIEEHDEPIEEDPEDDIPARGSKKADMTDEEIMQWQTDGWKSNIPEVIKAYRKVNQAADEQEIEGLKQDLEEVYSIDDAREILEQYNAEYNIILDVLHKGDPGSTQASKKVSKSKVKKPPFGSVEWQKEQERLIDVKKLTNEPVSDADIAYMEVQREHNKRLDKEEGKKEAIYNKYDSAQFLEWVMNFGNMGVEEFKELNEDEKDHMYEDYETNTKMRGMDPQASWDNLSLKVRSSLVFPFLKSASKVAEIIGKSYDELPFYFKVKLAEVKKDDTNNEMAIINQIREENKELSVNKEAKEFFDKVTISQRGKDFAKKEWKLTDEQVNSLQWYQLTNLNTFERIPTVEVFAPIPEEWKLQEEWGEQGLENVPNITIELPAKDVTNTVHPERLIKPVVEKEECLDASNKQAEGVGPDKERLAALYHWGEFKETAYISFDELTQMKKLEELELLGFNIREDDKDKVFMAYEDQIDEGEDGIAVKWAYAIDDYGPILMHQVEYGSKKPAVYKKATGEPDQDYDKEFYDAIVKQLDAAGIKGATHQEFDKYQGVYINVPGVDKFWTIDGWYTGKVKKEDLDKPYKSMVLTDPDGENVGGTRGDFFMKPQDKKLEGYTLTLTKQDGTKEVIENPTIAQIPDITEIMNTFQYEEGTEEWHQILSPEHGDAAIEVTVDDASELIEYIKANGKKPVESSKKADKIQQTTPLTYRYNGVLIEKFNKDENTESYHIDEGNLGNYTTLEEAKKAIDDFVKGKSAY